MGAQENKQVMQEIFAGLARGDRTLMHEYMADDFRIVVMGQTSWSQAIEGKEKVRQYREFVRSCFKDPGKTVPERFIADGDLVVVEGRGDNYSASGERYDNHYCLIYRFSEGKIVEMREYMDTAFCEKVLGIYPKPHRQD